MRREFPIHSNWKHVEPDELVRLFHFTMHEKDLAAELDVTEAQIRRWKDGKEPVPSIYVKYLQRYQRRHVIEAESPWNGATAVGERLVIDPGISLSLEFEELERLPRYRQLYHLYSKQTDLIEQLLIERDYFKAQCHKQARFGMVLNSLFPDP